MILFSAAVLCLAAVSCQKEKDFVAEESEIQFNFTINAPGGQDTKAAKKGWVSGDKLNIWFDGNGSEQSEPDLIITYNGSTWVAGALRSGVQAGLLAAGKLSAVYEGYNDVSSSYYTFNWYGGAEWFYPPRISNSFTGYASSYASPLTVYASSQNYTYSENTVSATLSGWVFRTSFKVLVTNLAASADNCIMQVKDEDDVYADATGAWLIRPNSGYTEIGNGSSNYYGYSCGVQEADGIAFYYNGFVTTDKKVTFRLTTDLGTTEKSYITPTAKTIDTSAGDKCIGVVIDYSKFIPGALKGKFTVNAGGDQVYFSKGNLQATTTDSGENWTWSFAEHQYDCPGGTGDSCDNMKATADGKSSVENCTIGLFGWSTNDNTYFGINSSTAVSDWDGTFVDWGTLEIGGAPANTWRTPTQSEFTYLLSTRTTSTVCGTDNARYARATVNSVEGNILFPDVYTHPDGVANINNINVTDASNSGNIISAADWAKMEAAGAVFLPQAGYKEYRYSYVAGLTRGYYWTSTSDNTTMADHYLQQATKVAASYSNERMDHFSVRLVHDL